MPSRTRKLTLTQASSRLLDVLWIDGIVFGPFFFDSDQLADRLTGLGLIYFVLMLGERYLPLA